MASIKKSNKKKIIIPICIVLVIAIAAGSAAAISARNSTVEVSLATISSGNIVENVSATGLVSSGASREYSAATVADCKEVFVKVGDKVKKGDVLATFSTDTLDSQISSLQSSYNNAKTSYINTSKEQKAAAKNLKSVNSRINTLEKDLKKLQGNSAASSAVLSAARAQSKQLLDDGSSTGGSGSGLPSITIPTATTDSLDDAIGALLDLADTLSKLSDDIETTNAITRTVMIAIADAMASGEYSPEAISKVVGDAVADAIQKGLVDETKLIIDSGIAIDAIRESVKAVDWDAIGKAISNSDNALLASTELQLTALYAQRELLSISADTTLLNSQKQIMDTTKSALDTLKQSQQELKAGWVASIDGIVTECTVASGEQTSALQTGLKIENLGDLVATISLGEYDVHKVKVGMPAVITTAYGEYTGEIVSIAPTATGGGSEGSILDSVGSMAGISGLSSLTSKGAGVECVVTINEPDDNIIAGFDANVEIKTGSYSDIPTVPIESIVLEKDGTYVYLYDEEEQTVTKTRIETGAVSDTAYEVTGGLSMGDRIVATPAADYKEDTFKVRVK